MNVPGDCKWCRYENTEHCTKFLKVKGECEVVYAGIVWHKDEKMSKQDKEKQALKLAQMGEQHDN